MFYASKLLYTTIKLCTKIYTSFNTAFSYSHTRKKTLQENSKTTFVVCCNKNIVNNIKTQRPAILEHGLNKISE